MFIDFILFSITIEISLKQLKAQFSIALRRNC